MDYKAKIRKLLALAGNNSSPEEAQAAMLRARELMAKHKLTEADCATEKAEVAERLTNWKTTTASEPWMIPLSCVIARHYCCEPYTNSEYRGKTYAIGFVGFPDDLDVCIEVYNYAVRFVRLRNEERRVELKGRLSAKSVKVLCNSYGIGFSHGVQEAYEKQERETNAGSGAEADNGTNADSGARDAESNRESWGLVMAVPQEVTAYLNKSANRSKKWDERYSAGSEDYRNGREAGASFVTTKALKGAMA